MLWRPLWPGLRQIATRPRIHYLHRMPTELNVMSLRNASLREPALCHTAAYVRWAWCYRLLVMKRILARRTMKFAQPGAM
jgi:hypothetical protein